MVTIQQMHQMDAETVAIRLGGIKFAENDWRVPDFCCVSSTKTNSNPAFHLYMENGEMHWWCHRCNDAGSSTESLQKALGEEWSRKPVVGVKQYRKVEQDREVLPFAQVAKETRSCPSCGQEGANFHFGALNGYPLFWCESCEKVDTTYDTMFKQLVENLGNTKGIRFSTQYKAVHRNFVWSNRTEPGKEISGKGENYEVIPKVLEWKPRWNHYWEVEIPVLHEGEKAAAAGASCGVRGFSYRGGKATWKYCNFDALEAEETLVLWPDDHPDGRHAMVELAESLSERFPEMTIYIVKNDGLTNDDAADFPSAVVHQMIFDSELLKDYLATYTPPEPKEALDTEEPAAEKDDEESLEWWCADDALADIGRLFRYDHGNYAYIWTPGISSDSPSLGYADDVGYWRTWNPAGRNQDLSKLVALIGNAREMALTEAETWYQPNTIKRLRSKMAKAISVRRQGDIKANLSVKFHQGNHDALPVFQTNSVMNARKKGLLTLRDQCIDMQVGEILDRETVKPYGIIFDSQWSEYKWVEGAYQRMTYDTENVRDLMTNLGDTVYVIIEMLMTVNRRIAVVKSKASGRGKSAIVNLMKRALGSLVGISDIRNVKETAMSRSFPAVNNALTRSRIVIFPEANSPGLENVNLPALIHVSGEPMLDTEYKYEDRIDRPRIGSPFLTMGEWLKDDLKKGGRIPNWNIQGMWDEEVGRGRLWAYDLDDTGAEYLPEYIFASTDTQEGAEAFIDYLMQVTMESGGIPDVYTPKVLTYIHELVLQAEGQPEDGGSVRVSFAERRVAAVESLFMMTDEYEDFLVVRGLAQKVDTLLQQKGREKIVGTDQDWQLAIRKAFNLPSTRQQVIDGQPNQRVFDGEKRNYPIRGVATQ